MYTRIIFVDIMQRTDLSHFLSIWNHLIKCKEYKILETAMKDMIDMIVSNGNL